MARGTSAAAFRAGVDATVAGQPPRGRCLGSRVGPCDARAWSSRRSALYMRGGCGLDLELPMPKQSPASVRQAMQAQAREPRNVARPLSQGPTVALRRADDHLASSVSPITALRCARSAAVAKRRAWRIGRAPQLSAGRRRRQSTGSPPRGRRARPLIWLFSSPSTRSTAPALARGLPRRASRLTAPTLAISISEMYARRHSTR